MAKKSRGRDVTITTGTVPLNPTRLMGVSPLGVPFASPSIVTPSYTRSHPQVVSITASQPTPSNRMAKNATRNNLYSPAPLPKKVSICAGRHIRKQVLFAIGKGGRNGQKTARYTRNSKVKC